MKVNISYSVALEEVLPLVEKLYKENKKEFNGTFSSAATTVESSFTDEQLQAILLNIKKMRVAMVQLDEKLEECVSILGGYQKIITDEQPQFEPELLDEGELLNESVASG